MAVKIHIIKKCHFHLGIPLIKCTAHEKLIHKYVLKLFKFKGIFFYGNNFLI